MLKEIVSNQELKPVIETLKHDICNCLYLYVDLTKYGVDNPNLRVWVNDMDHADVVLMKYHEGFQIYTIGDSWDREGALEIIEEISPERIAGTKPAINSLHRALNVRYTAHYGVIMQRPKTLMYQQATGDRACVLAEVSDIPEIVDLLLSAEEFGQQYDRAEFIEQFEERFRTGMGRSMIMRTDGKIIAHVGTFAEADSFVITSGSVVRQEYRNTDCFERINAEFDELISVREQKDAYFFVTNKRLLRAYSKMFPICAEYGKLVKMKEESYAF